MSVEPNLDHNQILDVLCATYGLTLDRVSFLEDGMAHAYQVEGPDGRFLLKLLPDTPSGILAAQRIATEVPLLATLRDEGILIRIPHPRFTLDSAAMTAIHNFAAILYDWIDAWNLSRDWLAALPELAPLLGRLHAGTPRIMARVHALPMAREDFSLPFAAELKADLQSLHHLTPEARSGLHQLRDLLGPHEPHLHLLMARITGFQAAARTRSHDFVVCHTDAHGGNVMRDAADQLWIIDWETARLAPREHDLWMLHARLPEVLPAYEAALEQSIQLDLNTLGFYFHRRVLEDLAVDLATMRENTRPEQDAESLRLIRDYVLPASLQIEAEFDDLAAALILC